MLREFSPDQYRSYLAFLAARKGFQREAGRFSVSDVIQETMFHAYRARAAFQGETEMEYKAWLRRILVNVITTRKRRQVAQKRAAVREQSLQELVDATSMCLEQLAVELRPPSQDMIIQEDINRIVDAIERLPDNQQTAFRLRYLEQMSLLDLAQHMEVTRAAAAGLVRRAIAQLRKELHMTDLST